jgi:AcrR family transcriptional regulator
MYTKSKETTQSIIDAARALFTERQFAAVTINDIAAYCNISKGALYHHFSGKEDIYLNMMHHSLAHIKELSERAMSESQGSCRERLHASILDFLQLPDELLRVLGLVRRDINIFEDPIRTELIQAYQEAIPLLVEAIIQEGIDAGDVKPIDARLLTRQTVALVEVALHPYSRRQIGDSQAMATYVVDILFDGIAN